MRPSLLARHAVMLLLLLAATRASAQVSTLGTDFWACDMENTEGGVTEPFGILVANAGVVDAVVTIEGNTGTLGTTTVPPGALGTFTFDRTRMMLGTSLAPNAYHVLATQPVTVFQFNPLSTVNVATNDASTVLPVPSLGTTYRPLSRDEFGFGGLIDLPGTVALVGLSVAPTTVTFVPNGAVRAGFVPATPAGTPIVFTLNRFDVAHFMTDVTNGADFTGSLITSDRPIAVFGGARCAFVPSRVQACDHLEEQMFPVTAWGKDVLAVKSPPRGLEPDIWRVVASEDATQVTLTPDPVGAPITLAAGAFIEFSSTEDIHIVANKPIQVGQYLVGQGYDPSLTSGDPSLILAIPTEQFDDDYLFLTPDTYDPDYVVIVKPNTASVTLDGSAVSAGSFRAIGTTGYSRAQIPVADGVHRVTGTAGVGVYVIGYTGYASYGYYAGAKSADINSPITCDPGGPYGVGCAGGTVTFDGTGSSGPGPLTYLWSALTPGLVIASPTAATTSASPSGTGPWSASLTVTDGLNTSSCIATIDATADVVAPIVTCPAQVDAVVTAPGGTLASVSASVTDECDPSPLLTNDWTAGGADATGLYPCGETLVTFTGSDAAGHITTCVTRVVIQDLPPTLTCAALVNAVPTVPAGAFVIVQASAADACDGVPFIVNDRTAGGADASDNYPCGETLVTFTTTDAAGQIATCVTRVVVASSAVPAGVSESAAVSWLRVSKVVDDPTVLDITMQVPADLAELVNLYAGTILPADFVAYDHVPVACKVSPLPQAPGIGLLRAPFDAGVSHYYLVSASNCLAEGSRGSRSDGVARPDLPTDCGALM